MFNNQIFGCLIRENEMGGACGTYGEDIPEGKRLLGRLKCMWEYSIKMKSKNQLVVRSLD
jgi:hypothetical protein